MTLHRFSVCSIEMLPACLPGCLPALSSSPPVPRPPQSQYIIQQRNVTHLEAHATGVKEEEIRPSIAFLSAPPNAACLPACLPALSSSPPVPRPPQSQYIIQQRNVTHLEAHATGVKEEEIRPAIAFLRRHLGLASADELAQPAAAAAGAARGEPKEGLDPKTAEDLAEVQFPSS
jgi:hypothetical protein